MVAMDWYLLVKNENTKGEGKTEWIIKNQKTLESVIYK